MAKNGIALASTSARSTSICGSGRASLTRATSSSIPPSGFDEKLNIAAKGLTGEEHW